MHGIAAAASGLGRFDIFYLQSRGFSRQPGFPMAHMHWDGANWVSGLDALQGDFTTVPAAVASHPTHSPIGPVPPLPPGPPHRFGAETIAPPAFKVDVFAVDQSFAMRQMTLLNGVAPYPPVFGDLGGIFTSSPGAIAWASGERIDLFGLGTDYSMFRKVWDGALWTSEWENLGGTFSSTASVVSMQPDQIDVFARGADYTLRHRAFTAAGPVTDWQNLGGALASPPAAVSWGADRLDVFAVGSDGALCHTWWDGQIWNAFEKLGGNLRSAPSAVSPEPERLDVFATGVDGLVYHFRFEGEVWFGPDAVGIQTMTEAPTAVSRGPDSINIIAPGTDSNIYFAEIEGDALVTSFGGDAMPSPFWGILGDKIGLPTRYRFSVDLVNAITPRSLDSDTDTAQATIAPGIWPVETLVQHTGSDIGGTALSQWQTNILNFEPITVEMCESASFNYVIINNGHADQVSLDTALTGIGSAIATKAIQVLSGVSLLGTAAGLIVGELGSFLFQDCDGLVAAEQIAFGGRDLFLKTTAGSFDSVVTSHAGYDSPSGCGPSNSEYQVTWSAVQV